MIRTLIATVTFLIATISFAQDEVWSKITNWREYLEDVEMSTITAYALYDIDKDGVNEAFVRDVNNDYACLTCGGGEIKVVTASFMTTSLFFRKDMPYDIHQGGCGTGCHYNEICKIENSKFAIRYSETTTYGPGDKESHDCCIYENGNLRNVSYKKFYKLIPELGNFTNMEELDWMPVDNVQNTGNKGKKAAKADNNAANAKVVTFKDANGYCYQIVSGSTVALAPGGSYSGNIVIPSQVSYDGKQYTVASVLQGAMWKKDGASNIGNITSVTLPETVKLVGADAFRNNASLKTVKYSDGTRIEVRSFWGCPKLKIEKHEPLFTYTEPYSSEEFKGTNAYQFHTRLYCPTEQPLADVDKYCWAIFKSNHNGVSFDSYKNLDKEDAMACFCSRVKNVKAGLFRLQDPDCVESMYKGYLTESGLNVILADNGYVATHELPPFSRWIWGEDIIEMPQEFVSKMEKLYGRKVKYSHECGHLLNTDERLVITEFVITNHECMYVLSWIKDGNILCSYVEKRETDPEYEEYGVWNVDDDGTYGIPHILTIARDERGNIELFLLHGAPESLNYSHLVQNGSTFKEIGSAHWYVWVDSPM